MRLLHILPSFAPGGTQSRVAALVNGLGNSFDHTIVAIDGDFSARSRIAPNAPVTCLPFRLATSSGLHPGNLVRLHRLLRAQDPDVLLTYSWGAIEAALANRLWRVCPHLHCEDGFSGTAAAGQEPVRRRLMRRFVIGRNTRLVVPSRSLAQLATDVWHVPGERVRYLPNGVDTTRFNASDAGQDQRADGSGNLVTVGTLCRLSTEKNIPRLLRAFAALLPDRRLRLLIAGDGPERAAVRSLRAELGLDDTVELLGGISDAPDFLQRIDIFALSSDSEQLPYGVLEAMACGLPVVATDVGDVRHMLSPANREFVVPVADEGAFSAAIARLVQDPNLRRAVGAANRRHVCAEFDAASMIARYRDLLTETAETAG